MEDIKKNVVSISKRNKSNKNITSDVNVVQCDDDIYCVTVKTDKHGNSFNGEELLEDAKLTEKYANSLTSNEGVYLVPAFTGIGAPYWNAYSTGILTGITRGTTKAHIARAVLESMAYNVKDILEYMRKNKVNIKELRVDGGVTKNNFLMQFQADMLNIPIYLPENSEITVLGAIFMAGLGLGAYKSIKEIKDKVIISKTYTANMKETDRNKYYRGWHKAVAKCLYKEKN